MGTHTATATVEVYACPLPVPLPWAQALAAVLAQNECDAKVWRWLSNVHPLSLTVGATEWLTDFYNSVQAYINNDLARQGGDYTACQDSHYPQPAPQGGLRVRVATRLGTAQGSSTQAAPGLRAALRIALADAGGGGGTPEPCPPIDNTIVFEIDDFGLPPDIPPIELPGPDNPDATPPEPEHTTVLVGNLQITTYNRAWGLRWPDAVGPLPGEPTYAYAIGAPAGVYQNMAQAIAGELYDNTTGPADGRAANLLVAALGINTQAPLLPPPGITYEPVSATIESAWPHGRITITLLAECQTPTYTASQMFSLVQELQVSQTGELTHIHTPTDFDFIAALKADPTYVAFVNTMRAALPGAPGTYKFYLGILDVISADQTLAVVYNQSMGGYTTLHWRTRGTMAVAHTHYKPLPGPEAYDRSFVFELYDIALSHTLASNQIVWSGLNATQTLALTLQKQIINAAPDAAGMVVTLYIKRGTDDATLQTKEVAIDKAQTASVAVTWANGFANVYQYLPLRLELWYAAAEHQFARYDSDGAPSTETITTGLYTRLAATYDISITPP